MPTGSKETKNGEKTLQTKDRTRSVQKKQDAWRRLNGMSRYKHVKFWMRSDNHSLFTLINKLVAGRFLLALKLQRGKFETWSINRLARALFCVLQYCTWFQVGLEPMKSNERKELHLEPTKSHNRKTQRFVTIVLHSQITWLVVWFLAPHILRSGDRFCFSNFALIAFVVNAWSCAAVMSPSVSIFSISSHCNRMRYGILNIDIYYIDTDEIPGFLVSLKSYLHRAQ